MKPLPSAPCIAAKPLAMLCLAALLAGCASDRAFREGERLMREGQAEAGLKQLEQAVREHPENLQYRTAYIRSRELHLARLLAQGDSAERLGSLDEAQARYQDVLRLYPDNDRAAAGLATVELARRNQALLAEAEAALQRNDPDAARNRLRTILAQQPEHPRARMLLKEVEDRVGKPQGVQMPQLAAGYRRRVTVEFRDAPLRSVFDALSRQSGINFVFDKDVRTEGRTTVFARDTAIADAVDMLLTTNQLAKKVLNDNTLLIYPNQPQKLREYQELVVKGFFLSNTDAKNALNMVKTLAKSRDVYVDEKLNLLFVRDTPEAILLVEKLLRVADQPEPEVMLEVEILEVKRSKLQELGVQWPTQLSVLTNESTTTSSTTGGVLVTTSTPAGRITIDDLRHLSWGELGVSPNPSLNLRSDDSDVNLLANPRIRVRNKEKAKIHIGDKVPVITANVTSTGVTSESVAYLEVGLKLDVEPQVHLQGDVAIKVGMEVSNIVREVKSNTGTLTYQLGSRNATTTLQLKDGETQVLAGLISDEDRAGASKVPGLGDIPLLGRLFSSHRDENNKTEIVLLITPHILRNVERPELADAEFFVGTEATVTGQPMLLRRGFQLPEQSLSVPAPPTGLPEAREIVPLFVEPAAPPQP